MTDPTGYVFHRHGRPLHPKTVLDHFHLLCDKAGVPRTALHDLRHLAASFSLAAGVPLPNMSKTLRHRTLSTSANIYAELTPAPPAQASTASPGSSTTPTAKNSAPASAAPAAPHASTRAPTGPGPPIAPRAPTTPPRTGPCGRATTMRPPADTTTERAGTWFPKYRLSVDVKSVSGSGLVQVG
ncbi:tyrosine-type recombinase/integrase [Kitasatospora sp. NPDC048407]|uniref:tyrosine-type recombinase/integrase n=1 Tax=Kitasatospora sp. NPDC048407 TaxID=3364051 RepID=UPI00371D4270